jgi:hypothetical protein
MDKIKGLERIAKAIKLIRNEKLLGFRVEIEIESTIYPDTQSEKQDRTAFIASVTQFMTQAMQISAAMPQAVPLLGKLLQFGIRGFKVGRELEQAIEDFTDEAAQVAKQHAQAASSQPNPEQIKANAMMAKAQADIQSAQMKMETDKQSAAAEVQRQQMENAGEQANSQADTAQKQLDLQMRRMEMEIELTRLQMEKIKAQTQLQIETQKARTSQQESFTSQQESAMGHAADQSRTLMEGAIDHHKLTKEAELAEQERQAQKKQMDHERKMQQGEHKIAQTKLQQQRVQASKPRTVQ